ncbi:AAA family ATPase [Methylobacterium sp. W2]|uniref:AAA family ATPase n=1 Tax=Methylobacterium sp. W2 TaxID=2598107 RepID=UPI001D0C935D|nr:AAA family ATPase [Methylobacterium sp. W2]MCC0805958.1 AAA family ATPase [Methylobacterium sp. W2]
MLKKFKAIEEIGRFSKLTQRAEPFTKLSLIFGRNGYGKSTLCAILRSASELNSSHITTRKRLSAVNDPRVETLWGSSTTFSYSIEKWNACPGTVHIFDQEYVARNLHVGDSVTRDNKRSLLPIVLGDQGVLLADEVLKLDKEQREVDDERKRLSRQIMLKCRGILEKEVSAFCKAEVPPDVEAKIDAAARRVELNKQATVVKQKKNIRLIAIGNIADTEKVLSESIDGIAENATQLITKHIETHQLGAKAHAWLEYGTTHAPEGHCPYCAQATSGVPLVAAYQVFFSDEVKALKTRVDELWNSADALLPEKLSELITNNNADFAYWVKICDIPTEPTIIPSDIASIGASMIRLKEIIEEKRRNILEPLKMGEDASSITCAIESIQCYNNDVLKCNSVIDEARTDTAQGDLSKLEVTHEKWLAMGMRSEEEVKVLIAAFIAAENRLADIKKEKITAQTALTSYTKKTMAARQIALNKLLSDFGANFRVVDAETTFIGREPNTEFAIEIGTHKVKAGEKSKIDPCFKTVLSTGDKTTLALAFFISQIEADPKLDTAVIVFDDPFSSQDLDRQFQTSSHIRSICENSCQTIVLSHDPRFLQLIEKNANNAITSTYQLQCSDEGIGFIERWSSADELKSLYLQQSEIIREYASHKKLLKGQSLNSIHQCIRPFMEDYLRLRFPGRFADQAHIFEMANAVRDAGPTDPLATSVSDLFALNEYTRSNMHGGGNPPTEVELRAHCQKVVSIVGSY